MTRAGPLAPDGAWRTVEAGSCSLETRRLGVLGEPGSVGGPEVPVVLIGSALTADELLPMAARLGAGAPIVIAYRRRGYGGSTPASGAGSIASDAADCAALLDALGWERASVVGVSYSAAVALAVASTYPDRAATVVAIEPPPLQTESAEEFRAANAELLAEHRSIGAVAAADHFLARIADRHWRLDLERQLRGVTAAVERDAATFFETDIPALLSWSFSATDASRVTAPVLLVSGTASPHWFAEEVEALRAWLPHASHALISGADHAVAFTHADELARMVAAFVGGGAED